jgi:riboflavin kinase/FMN adenylyltransferase
MELVHGLPQPINELPTVLAIGVFDGVHLGHQQLIGGAVRRARVIGGQSAVLTFDPHPDLVVHPERRRLYLTSLDERIELIGALGIDLLIIMPFTTTLMAQTAQEYMENLCRAVALRELWVGPDFALGRKREGNIARLRELGQSLGYAVHPFAPLQLQGGAVSSTRIRAALQAGDMEGIPTMLGRRFSVQGTIIEGDKRGRTIGFPTANLDIGEMHILPADGVYVCQAQLGDEQYGAVTNIGIRPTFGGLRRTVEAYLLDFTGDVYGEMLRVIFLHRLRGEQKFHSVAGLVAQIQHDTAAARAWLAANRDDA